MADISKITASDGTTYDIKDISTRAMIASDYSTTSSYAVGDHTIYNGELYMCIIGTSSPAGTWDSTKWSKILVGDDKMDKVNPTGTGSFSLNRKTNTTIGINSVAEGNNCEASGSYCHAEGENTVAHGSHSHAEGCSTIANGISAHAEGYECEASGGNSHAEGYGTIAYGTHQHVGGQYNITDINSTYAEIIGNGTGNNARSNARTLDWIGNETIAGDLYFNGGANPLSTQLAGKQNTLTAGSNINIAADNTISATDTKPSDFFDYYSTELPNKTSSSNSTTWSEFGRFAINKGYWIITVAILYPKKAGGGRSVGLVYNTSNTESTTTPGGSTSQTVGSSGADVETNVVLTTTVNVTANGYIHIMGRQNSGGTISGTHYIRARGIKLM